MALVKIYQFFKLCVCKKYKKTKARVIIEKVNLFLIFKMNNFLLFNIYYKLPNELSLHPYASLSGK